MKKEIWHLVHWPKTGITKVVELICKYSDSYSHNIIILKHDKETEIELASVANKVICLHLEKSSTGAFLQLKKIIANESIDLIHIHAFFPGLLLALLTTKIPTIRTIHSNYPYFSSTTPKNFVKRNIEGWTIRRLKTTLACVSREIATDLPWNLSTTKIVVVDNGIDITTLNEIVAAPEGKKALGHDKDNFVFISMGRLEHQKAYDILIAGFSIAAKTNKTIRLVILGEGSERNALEELIKELKLSSKVSLPGHKKSPYSLIKHADCFISSSRYEGSALAVTEAMAAGLPVITTATSGISSILADGEDALVIEIDKPEAIALAMERAVGNPTLLDSLKNNGEQLVSSKYGVEAMATAYESLYQEAIGC